MKPTTSLYSVIQQCQVYFFYCNLKEKYYQKNYKQEKKKRYFICEICIIILTYRRLRPVGPVQQSIKLPSPKPGCNMLGLTKLCGMLEAKESKGSKRYFFLSNFPWDDISSPNELTPFKMTRMKFHSGMTRRKKRRISTSSSDEILQDIMNKIVL